MPTDELDYEAVVIANLKRFVREATQNLGDGSPTVDTMGHPQRPLAIDVAQALVAIRELEWQRETV